VGWIVNEKVDVFRLEMLDSYDCATMPSVLEIQWWAITDPARRARGWWCSALKVVVNISDQREGVRRF